MLGGVAAHSSFKMGNSVLANSLARGSLGCVGWYRFQKHAEMSIAHAGREEVVGGRALTSKRDEADIVSSSG